LLGVTRRAVSLGALLCFLICWPTLPGFGWDLEVLVFGLSLIIGTPLLLLIPTSLVMVIVSPVACWWFSRSRPGLRVLFWVLTFASLVAGLLIGTHVRGRAFRRLARNCVTLVDAIESHNRSKGRYPAGLSELVPAFIADIPSTGLLGYGPIKYRLPATTGSLFRHYELSVSCGGRGINFDSFVYWPEASYPKHMYGGWVESIDRWAYVHE
jgi:hypothetical protein